MRYFNNGFTAHPPMFVGWNQNDKSDIITLSGGLLTATSNSAGDGAVRSTLARLAGKYYAELNFTTIASGNTGGGLANPLAVLAAIVASASGAMIQYRSGVVYKNGSSAFSNGNMSAGGILRVAYDASNHLAWLAFTGGVWNGNAAYDPAAGTGGQSTSAFDAAGLMPTATFGANGDTCVINAGATSFTYGAPTGFNAWNTG